MSAIEVFADTSGWGNLVDPSQKHHAQAATIYRDIRRQGGKFIHHFEQAGFVRMFGD